MPATAKTALGLSLLLSAASSVAAPPPGQLRRLIARRFQFVREIDDRVRRFSQSTLAHPGRAQLAKEERAERLARVQMDRGAEAPCLAAKSLGELSPLATPGQGETAHLTVFRCRRIAAATGTRHRNHAFRLMRCLLLVCLVFSTSEVEAEPTYHHLRIIAPAAPGGGWDQTARAMQPVLQEAGIVGTSSVENITGAAGTIGLARFVSAERGNGDVTMLSGLIMLAAIVTHRSALTLHDVTPVARLIGEYEVVVVPAASPFRSLQDLIRAFKSRPESVSWGGGSAGGTDQILAGLIADAVGVPPRRVNYIAFSGGGEAMSAVLGGQVSVGINGLAEFAPQIEGGAVRVLGISSPERLPQFDAPTLREQGVDVALENWRSLVAPPDVSSADRQRLVAAIGAMVKSSAWQEVLNRYRWNDRYLVGEEFERFVDSEEHRVRDILRKFGTSTTNSNSFALQPYPVFVLSGLLISLGLFGVGIRRSTPWSSTGPMRLGWKATSLVLVAILVDVLLLEIAGFVIASIGLFWLTARAFDAAHPIRDALYAAGLSVCAYVVFARLLELPLPAGLLSGWI